MCGLAGPVEHGVQRIQHFAGVTRLAKNRHLAIANHGFNRFWIESGDEDDRNRLRYGIRAQFLQDRIAVYHRHHDVQENGVGPVSACPGVPFEAGSDSDDLAPGTERRSQEFDHQLRVLMDEMKYQIKQELQVKEEKE